MPGSTSCESQLRSSSPDSCSHCSGGARDAVEPRWLHCCRVGDLSSIHDLDDARQTLGRVDRRHTCVVERKLGHLRTPSDCAVTIPAAFQQACHRLMGCGSPIPGIGIGIGISIGMSSIGIGIVIGMNHESSIGITMNLSLVLVSVSVPVPIQGT